MPSTRMANGGAASSARIEVEEARADLPTADERGPIAGDDDDRTRRGPAGHVPSPGWILIRVNDDRKAQAFEYRLRDLLAATGVRLRRPARDTTRATVGVPPWSRARAWSRALRRTGEHRWGIHD